MKLLDFPRIQFFLTACTSLILLLILTKKWKWYNYLVVIGLIGSMLVQGSYLVQYTVLVPTAVPSLKGENFSEHDQISILLANVKMSNQNVQPILQLIESKSPDIVIAMEVDDWWDKQLELIEEQYPYTQETINNVAYGMTLYSKYQLKDVKTNYLNNANVPSFESVVQLKNGKRIILYSMHPVPPVHHEDFPDNAGEREVAMLKLGQKIKDAKLPIIVAGDFNDVSWGRTDHLVGVDNLLHDVRVGRGFYNSYNADIFLMRWPLDHVFVTKEFQLMEIERLPDIGSDHFPLYVKLVLKSPN